MLKKSAKIVCLSKIFMRINLTEKNYKYLYI